LRLWAFGTSKFGLGLEPGYFWSLTTPEFMALRRVYSQTHDPAKPKQQSLQDKKAALRAGLEMAVAGAKSQQEAADKRNAARAQRQAQPFPGVSDGRRQRANRGS
jgi:hypothetical protein